MTKHTPGPWTVVKNGNINSLVRYSDGENASYVAQCNDMQLCPEHGTVEANARLIAAAPGLLAALQLCVARDSSLKDNATVMAAIAKATGE